MTDAELREISRRPDGYLDLFTAYAGVCALLFIVAPRVAQVLGVSCVAIMFAARIWRDRLVRAALEPRRGSCAQHSASRRT